MDKDALKKTFVLIVAVIFLNVLLFKPSYTQPIYNIDFSGAGGGSAPTPTPTPPSFTQPVVPGAGPSQQGNPCHSLKMWNNETQSAGCSSNPRCNPGDYSGTIDPNGNGTCQPGVASNGDNTCVCVPCIGLAGTDPACNGPCQKADGGMGTCGPIPNDEENCGCN